jgi:hypothetical protein
MNLLPVSHELAIGDIYFSPLLAAALFGLLLAVATSRVFDHYRISRYLFFPPLVLIAMSIIYTVLIGTLVTGI